MNDAGVVAIVTEHVTGAYGFTMKTAANDCLHRVLPLRDPDQPRFWCVVVVRCTPGGLPDRSQPPWVGQRGLRREELSDTMGAIRADLSAWLAHPEQLELRRMVLVPGAVAPTDASGGPAAVAPLLAVPDEGQDQTLGAATTPEAPRRAYG